MSPVISRFCAVYRNRSCAQGGLRYCGAPGWNLQRGPFYTYETVVNREKINEVLYLYYWNKKSLSKQTNRQVIWTSQYETRLLWFQVSISCWRLDTISINFHKTPVEYFEYTVAPRRRSPRYHDHFNPIFPMLMYFLLFHQRDHPGIQTVTTVQLLQNF